MKVKLASGREVELHRPSLEDRIVANDTAVVSIDADGERVVRDSYRAMIVWCKVALPEGFDINELKDDEIAEIVNKAREYSTLGEEEKPN